MDKSLSFFTLSMLFFWLVLDEVYGHKYITQFVGAVIPFAG